MEVFFRHSRIKNKNGNYDFFTHSSENKVRFVRYKLTTAQKVRIMRQNYAITLFF